MKVLIPILISFLISSQKISAQFYDYPISSIDIKSVQLTDNFWLPKIKLIQQKSIPYAFEKCEKEGRMENFLIAGGKKEGKVRGKMPFDDTDLYKIIEGASYSLISNYDSNLDAYLDSVISIIKTGQEKDGYITTWFTIDRSHPPADWVNPPKEKWESEASSHELYNSGHLFEAAAAHYFATGKRNFLDIAIKNADLLVDNFGPGKLKIVPGHQIVETGLIKLYKITGNEKYLKLAKYFLDERGDSTRELYGSYSQDHLPVTQQNEVVGHAVRAVYMYAGMTDIAAIYHDQSYLTAVMNLWEDMVNYKLYITGGIGAKRDGEAFGDKYELPNLTGYAETCASIGSVLWNQRLFLLTGDSKYYDLIERTLYNGLISGLSEDGTEFFYPNPLESDGIYTFNMGKCTRKEWFDCSCCPTNLIRFIPSIPGLIYATDSDNLYINLFISDTANVLIKNVPVDISQITEYPLNGKIKILIKPEKGTEFTVKIRIPSWIGNHVVPGNLYSYRELIEMVIGIKINGKDEDVKFDKGYLEINKIWEDENAIEIDLPMMIRCIAANEKVKEDKNKITVEYGPFVYCAEEIDNPDFASIKINNNTNLNVYRTNISGLSDEVNVIKSGQDSDNVLLIPYYLWSNRGVGKMKVWIPRD